MSTYNKNSLGKLMIAEPDLITIFQEVVKIFDNSVIYGYRSPAFQFDLYKKGRSFVNSKWIITDKKLVVTYKDGTIQKSNHNFDPARAVDVMPYPINFKDIKRIHYFAGFVMCMAIKLKEEGRISHDIRWGGDFNRNTEVKDETFMDLAHYEIISR